MCFVNFYCEIIFSSAFFPVAIICSLGSTTSWKRFSIPFYVSEVRNYLWLKASFMIIFQHEASWTTWVDRVYLDLNIGKINIQQLDFSVFFPLLPRIFEKTDNFHVPLSRLSLAHSFTKRTCHRLGSLKNRLKKSLVFKPFVRKCSWN